MRAGCQLALTGGHVSVVLSILVLLICHQEPVIMSAGWESGRGGSIVARHEWKGLSKMPGALEDWVEKRNQEQSEITSRAGRRRSLRLSRRAQQHVPGAFEDEDDEE